MSLATFFDAACDDLHHVINYHRNFPAGKYRFTFGWDANVPSYLPLFVNEMEWEFTTPPAVAVFKLWERKAAPSLTDPIIDMTFTIIDCVPTITFKGTSHWWFGLSLDVRLASGAIKTPRWCHIMQDNDVAGSIGVYKYPFAE